MNEKVRDLFWKDPLSLTQAELQQIVAIYKEFMADREEFNFDLKTGERKKRRRVKRSIKEAKS